MENYLVLEIEPGALCMLGYQLRYSPSPGWSLATSAV